MKDPLPWDAVAILKHDLPQSCMALSGNPGAKSNARLSSEADFVWLRDEAAQIRKNLDTKSVSLNEAERRQEKLESKPAQTHSNVNGRRVARRHRPASKSPCRTPSLPACRQRPMPGRRWQTQAPCPTLKPLTTNPLSPPILSCAKPRTFWLITSICLRKPPSLLNVEPATDMKTKTLALILTPVAVATVAASATL